MAVRVLVGLSVAVGLTSCLAPVQLSGFACDGGTCAAGYTCDPLLNMCVEAIGAGDAAPGGDTNGGDTNDVVGGAGDTATGGAGDTNPPGDLDLCVPTGPETCDGEDNDCSGVPDDLVDVDVDCNAQLAGPINVTGFNCVAGVCGIASCQAGLTPNPDPTLGCDQACTETNGGNERCDGVDNNCDGDIDEGFNAGDPCGVGDCAGGSFECTADFSATVCSTQANGSVDASSPEQCDAADHDCDGDPANGFGLGTSCGVNVCAAGQLECDGQGGTRCDTMPGGTQDASDVEICDGLDNDCNGTVDDNNVCVACTDFFRDDDGDGFGVTGDSQCLVSPSATYSATVDGDCDDNPVGCGGLCKPDALFELLDNIDNDCDQSVDECLVDCDCGPGLVACHLFEGDVDDNSTFGNDPTVSNNVSYDVGIVGQAVRVAPGASESLIAIPDNTAHDNVLNEMTIEAWVYPDSLPSTGRVGIFDDDGQSGMFIYAPAQLLCTGAGSVQVDDFMVAGEWQHVACVAQGSTWRAYVNGVEVGTGTFTPSLNGGSTGASTLGSNSPSGDVFDGLIDNLRLWSIALPPGQIAAMADDRR